MNLNDLRMSLKAALDNMWARIDARITAIEQGGGGGVTGVKGNAESSYRQGDVNLTPANIGAVSTSDVINVAHGGTGANTAAGARTNLNVAEKQLCESPNSQWRLEIHDNGIIRVWRYDANIGWNIAGVLRDENGVVPVSFGGTGATTAAAALANLGVINRQFSVTFDSNGFGTVNYPPQGYTLMAGNLGPDRIITVQGVYVVARSISGWTDVITNRTLNVTLLYVKNN